MDFNCYSSKLTLECDIFCLYFISAAAPVVFTGMTASKEYI